MRWLDRYIDGMYANAWKIGALAAFGPFGRLGSIVNVLICAGIGILLVGMGLNGQGFGFAALAFPIALEIVFLRTCFRAFRGDFDEPGTEDRQAQ
jgi:hypothetical protein